MRRDEIAQISSALPGWYAYGKGADGKEFLSAIVCWALIENSSGVRYVSGMYAQGQKTVAVAQDEPGFIEYRYMPEGRAT